MNNIKNTIVISAFPACGKTHFYENNKNYTVLDSDSSKFSWIYVNGEKVRNPEFPKNYIQHIKENIGKVDFILVSSHKEVRDALDEANIKYCLVFPREDLRYEWVGRCFLRGNDEKFCKLIADKWDEWIGELYKDTVHRKFQLYPNAYLSDIMADIIPWFEK